MSDITQGQDAPSDDALFREALDAPTLEKFENPAPPAEKPADKPADPKAADKGPEIEKEAAIPAFRLREESDARRRVEAERDELRARIAAFERQSTHQQQQAPKQPEKVDWFENPQNFVRQEFEPMLDQVRNDFQQKLEGMSLENAVGRYGQDKVVAARTALEQGIRLGNPDAKAALDRAMGGHDPYGAITRWHLERETIGKVGGDLDAYVKAQIEKLLDDPDHQKTVIERSRQSALANGNTVHRPAQSKVPTTPSLANFGAGGGDETVSEPSDEQLFRQAVSAKRR